jgi:prophage antirepressor-like protein
MSSTWKDYHMNNIVPFNFGDNLVRIQMDERGNPWFVAKDVCSVLEIRNVSDACSRLSEDEKGIVQTDTLGGRQNMSAINESGLYTLIVRSDKEESQRFRKWVTSEVLPSIRKTGRYEVPSRIPITAIPDQALVNTIFAAQCVADSLKISDAGRIRMFNVVFKANAIPTSILPDYTEEKITKSLTVLLKEHGNDLSAVKANNILIAIGILEIKSRQGTKGESREFKALTDKGLKYGKNLISPQNERETQPHYFVDTFPELLDMINHRLREAA